MTLMEIGKICNLGKREEEEEEKTSKIRLAKSYY